MTNIFSQKLWFSGDHHVTPDQARGYKRKSASQVQRDHHRAVAHRSRGTPQDNSVPAGVVTRSRYRPIVDMSPIETVRSRHRLSTGGDRIISDIMDSSPTTSVTPLSTDAPVFVPRESPIPDPVPLESITVDPRPCTEDSMVDIDMSVPLILESDSTQSSSNGDTETDIDSDADTDIDTMPSEILQCPCSLCLYCSSNNPVDMCDDKHYKCVKCSDDKCIAILCAHCYRYKGHVRHHKYLIECDVKD